MSSPVARTYRALAPTLAVAHVALILTLTSCRGEDGAPGGQNDGMAGREAAPSAGEPPPRIDLETCRREPADARDRLAGRIAFYRESAAFEEVDPPIVSVMNTDGSGVTHLRETNAYTAAWSPDGTRLAFVGGLALVMAGMDEDSEDSAEIFVISADGSGLTQLTRYGPGQISGRLSWSPDGTRLAFVREGDIHVISADGSGPGNLTNHPADDYDVVWSPDGGSLAFVSDRGGNTDVYVMNADGAGVRRLTSDPGPDVRPAWSPDGMRLAFISQRDDTTRREGRYEIYVVNADGSGPTKLTNDTAHEESFSWSPDGTRLAFSSDRDGRDGLYIASADGSGLTHLSNSPEDFAWSPDGRRLAFVTRGGPVGSDRDLYIVNADGSSLTRYGYAIAPAWSPDGTMLAFTRLAPGGRVEPGGERIYNLDIFVMNADCSGLRQLTEDRNYPNYNDHSPIWLPAYQQSSTQAPTGGARP